MKVGADQMYWPNVLGHNGIGKINEIGQKLEFCCWHKLCDKQPFLVQGLLQSLLETSMVKSLAPIRPYHFKFFIQ